MDHLDMDIPNWHKALLQTLANALDKIGAVGWLPMDNIIMLPAPVFALARERELDPRDVLTDLFEEELLPDPAAMADAVIQRLADDGFEIRPADRHGP